MEVGVQTDLFVDRPATPVYVPAKTGADAFTQIYPGDVSCTRTPFISYLGEREIKNVLSNSKPFLFVNRNEI